MIPYLKGRFGFQRETSFFKGSIDYHLISSCVIFFLPSSHSGVFGLIVRDYEVALNPSAMYSEFCTRVTSAFAWDFRDTLRASQLFFFEEEEFLGLS